MIPTPPTTSRPLKATLLLLFATVLWGISFPTMKALAEVQAKHLPQSSSWFYASLSLTVRFGVAALIVGVWTLRSVGKVSRPEVLQGLGLGIFGSIGILLQMDGLTYTPASTSAFLTQAYCLWIPLTVAIHERRWPSRTLMVSCAMVLGGVAVLSQFRWRDLHLGRGEWETLLASLFFTGQIIWLNRKEFSGNRSQHTTLVMFASTAAALLPIVFISANHLADIGRAMHSKPAILLTMVLTVFCTLGAYSLMNHWQPYISTTRAGLIYCAEPVFTSAFALFLPGWFSNLAGIEYADERMTSRLLLGGALITAANILILIRAAQEG